MHLKVLKGQSAVESGLFFHLYVGPGDWTLRSPGLHKHLSSLSHRLTLMWSLMLSRLLNLKQIQLQTVCFVS